MEKETFLRYTSMISPFIKWSEIADSSGLSKVTISNYINGKGDCSTTREVIAYYGWRAVKQKQKEIILIKPINEMEKI